MKKPTFKVKYLFKALKYAGVVSSISAWLSSCVSHALETFPYDKLGIDQNSTDHEL